MRFYFIETGLIKLSVLAPGEGVLLAISRVTCSRCAWPGNMGFGGRRPRPWRTRRWKAIPAADSSARLRQDALQEGFMHYLAERVTSGRR